MKLNSKYSINDSVVCIRNQQKQIFTECAACEGKGHVLLNAEHYSCPSCHGRKGENKQGKIEWQVTNRLTIGQVTVVVTNIKKTGMFDNVGEYSKGKNKQETHYMAYETGIGSGSFYYEAMLWPSMEEAQAECDRLNELTEVTA
jgi:hypothetical protein